MDYDFGDLVMRLKGLMSSVTAVLDDAEQRQIRDDPRVEAWLDKAQEAVFDAEGLLDEIEYDALRLKVTGDSGAGTSEVRQSKRPRVLDMLPFFRNKNESGMEIKIKKTLDLLEEIANQKDLLDVVENLAEEKRWQKPASTCLLEESEVYGRDNEKESLIKRLLSYDDSEKIRVIPIVGMGGVGKTILAQAVFNDFQVKEHFDLKLWVWVSEKFDVHKLISALLCSTSPSPTELRDTLAGKKFLIVLDDVWTDKLTDWTLMRSLFTGGLRGSRIILTTRSHEVARIGFSIEFRITARNESILASISAANRLHNDDQTILQDTSKTRMGTKAIWTHQGRVSSEIDSLGIEDGYWWRKYGQKDVVGAKYPRCYYACKFGNTPSCLAKKTVQRTDGDSSLFDVTYLEKHTCSQTSYSVQRPNLRPFDKAIVANPAAQHRSESYLRASPITILYLDVLEEEDSWQLFLEHAFGNNIGRFPDLEKIGRKIVKKCKGLPLALKTFGGLLRHKLDIDHWEGILETEIRELTDKQSDILQSLRLSYHHLPMHLKRCFAYCAIFPKEYQFEKEELISLWMAQNLLEQPQERTIEERGDQYFNYLVSISLIQPSNGVSTTRFVMHDLIVDLAIVVLGKYSYRLEGIKSIKDLTKETTRHLACVRIDNIAYKRDNSILNPTQLRTLLDQNALIQNHCSVSKTVLLDFFLNLKHLRALSFSGYHESRGPIDSICELKHLRFLKLSNLSIGCLPNSLCTMYNLQTLKFVRCDSLRKLPEDIHHLVSLRYLDASYTALEELPESLIKLFNLQKLILQGCRNLKHLPKDFHQLSNLRYLDASRTCLRELPESLGQLSNLQHLDLFCCLELKLLPESFHHLINLRYLNVEGSNLKEMPEQLSKLKCLETLSTFVVGKARGSNIRELGNLPNLRGRLCIKELQNLENPEDVFKVKLWKKSHLEDVEFVWASQQTNDRTRELGILTNLVPNPSLVKLKIRGYGDTTFPDWLSHGSFCNILHLSLSDCNNCVTLPELGQLPYLKKLQIERFDAVVTVGPEFYGTSSSRKPFASLEELSFHEMGNWKEWSMPDGDSVGFPNLKKLTLNKCINLELDLHYFLPSLTELLISTRLVSSLQILESTTKLYSAPISRGPTALKILHVNSATKWFLTGKLFPNLTSLTVGRCTEMKSLPENLHNLLPLLECFCISDCMELESFPTSGLPSSLRSLLINNCNKLVASRRNWKLQTLCNLAMFSIRGYQDEDMESFPEQGLLPTTVTQLDIFHIKFLKSLNNEELQRLAYLRRLAIFDCPNLQIFTEEALPDSLEDLTISGCPLLKDKCERGTGAYWDHIAHIPNIKLHG